MNREIEAKFEIPQSRDFNPLEFTFAFGLIANSNGYTPSKVKRPIRQLTYFDNSEYQVYKAGATLRKVEGFNILKDKARFRFDLKLGYNTNRLEENIWSDKEVNPNECFREHLKKIGITDTLYPVARTNYTYTKFELTNKSSIIEASIDIVSIINGPEFKEFELELIRGEEKNVEFLSELTEKTFHLKRNYIQKYSRIIELIHPELANRTEHDAMKQPERDTIGGERNGKEI